MHSRCQIAACLATGAVVILPGRAVFWSAPGRGVSMLDAPVAGSTGPAEPGRLVIVVGESAAPNSGILDGVGVLGASLAFRPAGRPAGRWREPGGARTRWARRSARGNSPRCGRSGSE